MGDMLIVTVTPDQHVGKGPGRPLFPASIRCEVLAALECVDAVAPSDWPTAVEAISLLRPDVYVKGPECRDRQSAGLLEEMKAVAQVGGRTEFTDGLICSSTDIIKRLGV